MKIIGVCLIRKNYFSHSASKWHLIQYVTCCFFVFLSENGFYTIFFSQFMMTSASENPENMKRSIGMPVDNKVFSPLAWLFIYFGNILAILIVHLATNWSTVQYSQISLAHFAIIKSI